MNRNANLEARMFAYAWKLGRMGVPPRIDLVQMSARPARYYVERHAEQWQDIARHVRESAAASEASRPAADEAVDG